MVPESARLPPAPFFISICLIAISNDFLDIVLPNPVLSLRDVTLFTGFLIPNSGELGDLRGSTISVALAWTRPLPVDSAVATLPLVVMGDGCRLVAFTGPNMSEFPLTVTAAPGRDLPAESGRSGKVVLRLGGVSREKSGGTIGCWGDRSRGLGELGLDAGAPLRPFESTRPLEIDVPADGDGEGAELLRVGVDGRELDRGVVELIFAAICGLELGVEGLEFCDGRGFSIEELVETGRILEGVEDRDAVARADGVEGLAAEEERVSGEDGLV